MINNCIVYLAVLRSTALLQAIIIIIIRLFRTIVQQHDYVIRTAKQCACAYLCVSVLVT